MCIEKLPADIIELFMYLVHLSSCYGALPGIAFGMYHPCKVPDKGQM